MRLFNVNNNNLGPLSESSIEYRPKRPSGSPFSAPAEFNAESQPNYQRKWTIAKLVLDVCIAAPRTAEWFGWLPSLLIAALPSPLLLAPHPQKRRQLFIPEYTVNVRSNYLGPWAYLQRQPFAPPNPPQVERTSRESARLSSGFWIYVRLFSGGETPHGTET